LLSLFLFELDNQAIYSGLHALLGLSVRPDLLVAKLHN